MPYNQVSKKNLRPFPKGHKYGGRKKGSLNFSTLVKDVVENEELLTQIIKSSSRKPWWFDSSKPKTGMQAVITAMMIKAIGGDVQAATWLKKVGYGEEFEPDNTEEPTEIIFVNHVPSRENNRKVFNGEIKGIIRRDTPKS
jgi:hypothetical protein